MQQSAPENDKTGGVEALYPFLYTGQNDLATVLQEVRRSTEEKAREIMALRDWLGNELASRLSACAHAMASAFRAQGKLLAFGNGGSSTDAQALAQLFLHPPVGEPLPAFALTNDVAGVTALANDVGFDVVFAHEEGFPVADLQRIVQSMAAAAASAGVASATGDTKVVQRGKADGCFINTAGVGVLERPVSLGAVNVQPGDAVLVSGPIGDHGITIMLARGELDIMSDITSDTAPLTDLVACLLNATPAVRCLRDATRGGVATILNEVATVANVAVVVDERAIPVRTAVRSACKLLGIDPLYVACEGRLVAMVQGSVADTALQALRAHPFGKNAAIIGTVKDDPPGLVLLKTQFGGTRIVDMLVGDPLPRIC